MGIRCTCEGVGVSVVGDRCFPAELGGACLVGGDDRFLRVYDTPALRRLPYTTRLDATASAIIPIVEDLGEQSRVQAAAIAVRLDLDS